jgi:hypothetical protein
MAQTSLDEKTVLSLSDLNESSSLGAFMPKPSAPFFL